MTISTLVVDTIIDSNTPFINEDGVLTIIGEGTLSVIANLVLGINQTWTVSPFEWLTLKKEVESGLSYYSSAFDIVDKTFYGETITVEENV